MPLEQVPANPNLLNPNPNPDPNPDPVVVAAPAWAYGPDNWRSSMAAGDEKEMRRLERMSDPGSLYGSYRALEQKVSSGDYKKPPAADAKPEEVSAWRAARGIPDKPEGYLEKLPQGLVIGEADKPLIGKFAQAWHAAGAEPGMVHATIKAYYEFEREDALEAQRQEADAERKTEADLVAAMGPVEYRRANDHLNMFLAKHGESGKALQNARGPDGLPILNTPSMRKWLMDLARDIDPISFVMPGSGGGDITSIDTELQAISEKRRKDRPAYDRDQQLQQRERDLIDLKAKMGQRRTA